MPPLMGRMQGLTQIGVLLWQRLQDCGEVVSNSGKFSMAALLSELDSFLLWRDTKDGRKSFCLCFFSVPALTKIAVKALPLSPSESFPTCTLNVCTFKWKVQAGIWITTFSPADSVVSAKGDQYLLLVVQAIKATLKKMIIIQRTSESVCAPLCLFLH